MMCISTIALDALLKLVGGQVIQKLGEDGLSGIHPSLSAISVVAATCRLLPVLLTSFSNRKTRVIS